MKAFRIQYSNHNWAQQEFISDLCISQVSTVNVDLEMAVGHNTHTCSLTCTGVLFCFFCLFVCLGCFVLFFKVYRGNLSLWNWKYLLNPELLQEVHAEFLVLRTASLVWHFYFFVVLLYF